MTDDEEQRQEHRRLGMALFNAAWQLIDKAERTADEDTEMLLAAAASRWHWGQIGGPAEIATGDWQVGHVAALLGFADVALHFAKRNLTTAEAEGWDGWRLASAHEGMARAYAAGGEVLLRDQHASEAQAALDREPEPEERDVIAAQLATVPRL